MTTQINNNVKLGKTIAPNSKIEPVKEYAIEFNNVSRRYKLHHEAKVTLQDRVVNIFKKNNSYEEFWALKNVNFKLEKGKTLGIIGKNGAGKSTLLKLATRILEPSSGYIRVNGRVSAMLELGTGFHPELSARDNIYLNGAFYGFDKEDMDERYERIVEFSELGKFIDTPVKHFSSGMYMRLGFAVAITVSPDILIIDEVLAVGDAAFGRKCHKAIEDLKNQSKAMVFVSHAAREISRFCDEVIYLANGEVVAQGRPGDILDEYMMDSMGTTTAAPQLRDTTPAKPKADALQPVAATVTPTSQNYTRKRSLSSEHAHILQDDGRQYQTNYGLLQREMQSCWQFVIPQTVIEPGKPAPEYYIALLNDQNGGPVTIDLAGYNQTSGLFDQSVGALRETRFRQGELPAEAVQLLPIDASILKTTGLLKLEASAPVAAQLIEFNPSRTQPQTVGPQSISAGRRRYFPFCDLRGNNACRFEVFNPSGYMSELQMTLYRDWADPVPQIRSFECVPHSQFIIDLNEELAGGIGERERGQGFYGGIVFVSSEMLTIKLYTSQVHSPSNPLKKEVVQPIITGKKKVRTTV